MHSLQLLGHEAHELLPVELERTGDAGIAVNTEKNIVYIALYSSSDSAVTLVARDAQTVQEVASFPLELGEVPAQFHRVVDLSYLPDLQALCLVLGNGEIILVYDEVNLNGEKIEHVGSIEAGVQSVSWSPDEELVVMTTGSGTLLQMTKDLNVITEFPIQTTELGEVQSHNVGWGKKETQFHGSEGKAAAQRKLDLSSVGISEDDDQLARVSWIGDGSLYCCSDIDHEQSRRVIHVYNREGTLQSTSEVVDRLEHVLDWRPTGNLIVPTKRLPHRHDVVFLERNGLRHGEFTLREMLEHKVLALKWNSDSTVLAILIARYDAGSQTWTNHLQLWTMNNYYYYLKQEIGGRVNGDQVNQFLWDPEMPLKLHTVSSNGVYSVHQFCNEVFTSKHISSNNAGLVAVVDGQQLLLTPFSYRNIPPPMSSVQLDVGGIACSVAFGPGDSGDGNEFAVLLADGGIKVYDMSNQGFARGDFQERAHIVPSDSMNTCARRQIAFLSAAEILCLEDSPSLEGDRIRLIELSGAGESSHQVTLDTHERILRLYADTNTGHAIVENMHSELFTLRKEREVLILKPLFTLPEICQWLGIIPTVSENEQQICVVALSDRSKLYVNEIQLAHDCTSFFVTKDFLIYTTSTHTARFLPLKCSYEELIKRCLQSTSIVEDVRRVERGSKIVLALHQGTNVILQMPRGNLETISPRPLVLSQVREALDALDFKTAFIVSRKHRVDLNLIYDHNPQAFMANVKLVVEQIADPEYLNLLLSSLRAEDVTRTTYKDNTNPSSSEPTVDNVNKINDICDAVRKVLETKDKRYYMQTILSTYVRKSPPDLESALRLLADLRKQDLSLAEDALKYTIFLCDVDQLYDVALGLYDFNLVLMVAQQSQRDPREYLPFLQELQSLQGDEQRYRIDDHLKRYAKAVEHLSKSGHATFAEVCQYIQKHELYTVGLTLYPAESIERSNILCLYGEHCKEKGEYREAAILFQMGGDKYKAMDAYTSISAWREVFALASQLNLSKDHLSAIAMELVQRLRDKEQYYEAATVAIEYAQDVETALEVLIKGYHWSESIRLCYLHNRQDLLQTHILPGMDDAYEQITDDIKEMGDRFRKQSDRLQELRREKVAKASMDLPVDDALDNVDMMSDTTSMMSAYTRYTQTTTQQSIYSTTSNKTAKMRKKEEKKKARGKKGSIYEEEYIIDSLRRVTGRVLSLQEEVKDYLQTLVTFGQLDRAKSVKTAFQDLMTMVEMRQADIFEPKLLETAPVPEIALRKPEFKKIPWSIAMLNSM
ncbi:hypothetical protein BZG36_00877 [Bifiguratus adelaidae]|uniref:Elongator complex protein 1 n=1 Tax=Bifiguratus adelaidae TaxID=1938954 RepID=A0A261Y5A9_9FUNG|nr:hypothetical protein BZG36_00877 [Bifiguratus adelaidae]